MAKRITGVGNNKTSRSKKTAKRLTIKAEMLAAKAAKKLPKGRTLKGIIAKVESKPATDQEKKKAPKKAPAEKPAAKKPAAKK